MKDTHIYNRMNNPTVMRTYINLLKTLDVDSALELYNNIKSQAVDHPKFSVIEEVYVARFNNKE